MSKRRATDEASVSGSDDEGSSQASSSSADERKSAPASPAAKKSSKAAASSSAAAATRPSYAITEEEEEADWNTARDEAEEAAALQAQLSGQKPNKKRRLQKTADVEATSKALNYRSVQLGQWH
jgi:hypothetical protein